MPKLFQKRFLALVLAPLLAVSVLTPVTFTACRTQSAQRITVNTLFTVHETVDKGYEQYILAVARGQLGTNSVPRVARSYNQFQVVYNAALALAVANPNAAASQSVFDEAKVFEDAVSAARRGEL